MNYMTMELDHLSARAYISHFSVDGGISEYNVIVQCTDPLTTCHSQIDNLCEAFDTVVAGLGADVSVVFKRYFLSDPSNQASMLPKDEQCAVSVIGQAPLNGSKVALWAYLQQDVKVVPLRAGLWTAEHSAYRHVWMGGLYAPALSSEIATTVLLGDYANQLGRLDCSLLDNCMRTWFFVRDIDINYKGVVTGRNDIFRSIGLSPRTHFIASTGISGDNADSSVTVTMDAYAVAGIAGRQVKYLKAADFLNSTIEYGVAFERGTAITYGDRRHIIISGTASINNKGEVMYSGDIRRQTLRMIDNVEALVSEADGQMSDLTHIIVYLRDVADYAVVRQIFEERFPDTPVVIVKASVCRPGWLIEMECMAITPKGDPRFPNL